MSTTEEAKLEFTVTREAWLEALRSGRYEQTKGSLRGVINEDALANGTETELRFGFCCLGVACDVQGVNWAEKDRFDGESDNVTNGWQQPDGSEYLTKAFAEHLGLTASQMRNLALANDNGKSFAEIADMIETGIPDNGTQHWNTSGFTTSVDAADDALKLEEWY